MRKNEFIQNRTNWCWAVACRMVGEQFIRNNSVYNFRFIYDKETVAEGVVRLDDSNGLRLAELEGVRTDIVRQSNGAFLLGPWQRLIVMNANSGHPGLDGNWPGDDEAKILQWYSCAFGNRNLLPCPKTMWRQYSSCWRSGIDINFFMSKWMYLTWTK
ncbi:MAG: hypothetical protein NC548_07635 [Lachnospiraceae bacterium]|nr:hypothetical protein [Lachnospiraceae bacterium]